MTRREFLSAVGVGAGWGVVAATGLGGGLTEAVSAGTGAGQTNIVLILADDLGYGELGVQGCRDIPTPHIDSIARNGVRFTDGYVSCPVCAPTRAGLMTGRYQQRFGFETNPMPDRRRQAAFGLPREEPTLAERLKPLGYATGIFGKWHLGFTDELIPTARGFDAFFGFLGGKHAYLPGHAAVWPLLRGDTPVTEESYLTDTLARESVDFIERHKEEPFFLYLPFNAVHTPLEASEKYLARFAGMDDTTRRTHAAMTAAMDDGVGAVLSKLREHDLEERTLIFFLSDNGGPPRQMTGTNGVLRGYKGEVYEGGIRVPFMVQWKGRLPAGKVYREPVLALDIHTTALAAAGASISPKRKLDGIDLAPYLTGEKRGGPHEALYWRFEEMRAIREGEWKLVKSAGGRDWELYDLAEDIGEGNDLSGELPAKVRELEAAWDAWNGTLESPRWRRERTGTSGWSGEGPAERRFRRLDTNGDGKLTRDEVPREGTFKRMDANGDESVTIEETREAMQHWESK